LKCLFSKCTGNLKPSDNGKTPKGLFTCIKCHSVFIRMIQSGKLVIVTNLFSSYNDKVIPLKELKKKVK
jgi:hypothetical protein